MLYLLMAIPPAVEVECMNSAFDFMTGRFLFRNVDKGSPLFQNVSDTPHGMDKFCFERIVHF